MLDAIIARLALAIISVDRDASYWGTTLADDESSFPTYTPLSLSNLQIKVSSILLIIKVQG